MFERGEEIGQEILNVILERGLFDGLSDEDYDDAVDGFMHFLDSVGTFENVA
jgi:hypothetical protein